MKRFSIFAIFFVFILSSCCQEFTQTPLSVTKKATDNEYDVFYINTTNHNNGIDLTIQNLEKQDVYVILSNTTRDRNTDGPTFEQNANSGEAYRNEMSRLCTSQLTYNLEKGRGSQITPLVDNVGVRTKFTVVNGNRPTTENVTCLMTTTLGTGTKQLSIFAEDSIKDKFTINQLEKLTEKFKTIYDYETNLLGQEWGPHNSSQLINENNNITILLSNMSTSEKSTTIGYFYKVNNFKTARFNESNERLMFYINGNYFLETNDGESWNIDGANPQQIISTLSHEFQHMIAFYQKVVKNNLTNDITTWLNEACSLATEDIMSYHLETFGPRGRKTANCEPLVSTWPTIPSEQKKLEKKENSQGRLGLFNSVYDQFPIFSWSSNSNDSTSYYYVTYPFMAYLLRNYGGATLLHDIVTNSYYDETAIEKATKVDLETLQRQWAVACLLSDLNVNKQKLKEDHLLYNNDSQWFNYTYNSEAYKLGSINCFNYYPSLDSTIIDITKKSDNSSMLKHSTNRIYKIGTNKSGTFKKNIRFDMCIQATVVIKKAK